MPDVVIFKVDRAKPAQKTITELQSAGWNLYGDLTLLGTAPAATDTLVNMDLFRADGDGDFIPVETLQKKYTELGYCSDVQAFVQYVQANPDVADVRPIGMQWQDEDGRHCYVAFDRWGGERRVSVYRNLDDWNGNCVFAGCRKSSEL